MFSAKLKITFVFLNSSSAKRLIIEMVTTEPRKFYAKQLTIGARCSIIYVYSSYERVFDLSI
jgi:hypothetical protein